MKALFAVCVLLMLSSLPFAGQVPQTPIPSEELHDVFPAGATVDQFTRTSDGQRTYYTTTGGELWLYDRGANRETRILSGSVWDLAVSTSRDALAYTKGGETRLEQYVWVLPLDPKTGLASGSERRLSQRSGDVPSISPDAKWVAFARDDSTGVGQSVVVTPISGGNERVVASNLPSSIGNIRWTPDGKTLFFGVNPPVPFTCAESCLSVPANLQLSGTIRRVAASGGPVAVVATTGNPSPGLSPDGTKLVFADAGGPRQFVVADASGQRLNTFTLPPTQIQQGWSGNSTLLTLTSGTIRRLRSVSISDGSSRILFESDGFVLAPALSPDGKMVSLLRAVGDRCEARIMNADGTQPKGAMLPDRGCGDFLTWTADQRSLIYTQYLPPDRRPQITLLEIATGQTKPLHESRPGDVNWVLDSDAVIVSELPGAGTQRRVSFSRVDLDGKTIALRELPFDEPASSFASAFDRTMAMIMRATPPALRLIRLDGDTGERVITPASKGYVLPRFSVSADKQWIAFRTNPTGNDFTRMNRVELIRLDRNELRTIELPFFAQVQNTLLITPGAQDLIVTERPAPGLGTAGVYVVNVSTRSVKKLFNYAPQGRLPEMVLSSDGRTLFALITEPLLPTVSGMDLSRTK